ncbi:MAG: 50S ribosomal protein L32 [Candidatus Levybacteria bacterium RIFCSPHIGHO2_01_FULL_37_17]|nr:MAG: 50S ribosomal protein L32 [Candidatus Levybacteria bacterium RIFCSPHIGHO2_01_FULL_37_17]OGH36779.1 MAG: 50S ribosomal protein L32 [Candidatus Levybacteria bacterium RIFCSPLOWO2_01_FULL_38_23]
MPQEPKKRHSRQRQGKRRAAIKLAVSSYIFCPNCHEPIKPHAICKNCGYYKGKQVIVKKEKKKEQAVSTTSA